MNILPLILILLPLASDGQAAEISPRTELQSAIPYALDLLAKENYEQFILEFARPDELQKKLEVKAIDELVRMFAKDSAGHVQTVLESIRDAEPKMNEEGNVATYGVDVINFSRTEIVFERVESFWYIRN